MGEEYFYCWNCQTRLSGSDFERGRAFQIRDRITCLNCVKELLPPLPLKEQEEVLLLVKEAQERARRPPSRPSLPAPAEGQVEAELPRVRWRYTRRRSPAPLWAVLAAAAVLAAIAVAWQFRPAEPGRPASPPAARPPLRPAPVPPREAAAREELRAADEFARAHPDDLKAQEARYRKALPETESTPVADEVRSRLEAVRRKIEEAFAADLASLDEQVRSACGREEYRKAVDLLEEARGRRPDTTWTTAVDQRIVRVNQEAWAAYIPLRDKAVEARRRDAQEEIRAVEERVRRWGLSALIEDLRKGLEAPPSGTPSAAAPPAPPASPSAAPPEGEAAYRKAWEQAASWARFHDFARALRELEEASRGIGDESLRARAAEDLENFRLAAEVRREAVQALPSWPRGRRLRLAWLDENGRKAEVEGTVRRADPLVVEIVRGTEAVSLPLGEVLPGALVEILRDRPGRDPVADARGAVVLCLLGGDLEGARKAAGEPPAFRAPEPYEAFARRTAEEEAKAPARALFWSAEREFLSAGTRGRALEKISALLSEHAASPPVRRNRGLLTQRLEAGRDYFFPAEAMSSSGLFTPASYPKVESCWTSETDVPPARARDNYVEFEFYALPDAAYRCWVQVGGCCAETFTFYYQTTDSGEAEPGAGRGLLARHQILFLKRFHAQHGGPKEPARWEWVAIPLPKYAVAGIKKVRLISDQQGFSVARAVVSSTRQAPPRDPELKELERALAAERAGGAAKEAAEEAPAAAPEPAARPWRPLFDGRTVEVLTRESAPGWRVEDGALVPVPGRDLPAETREQFGVGEVRVRFEVRDLEGLFFKILQGPEGSYRLSLDEVQLRGLEGRTLELVFTCRKEGVTAEIDGKAVVLARTGQPERGSLQFGAVGKTFRVLSIEHR